MMPATVPFNGASNDATVGRARGIDQRNVLTYLREKKIDLVINVPKNLSKGELDNDYKIRRTAIDFGIPLLTNARLASKFIRAFCSLEMKDLKIKSWNEYKAM